MRQPASPSATYPTDSPQITDEGTIVLPRPMGPITDAERFLRDVIKFAVVAIVKMRDRA